MLRAAERRKLFGALQTGACPPLSRDPGASESLYWPALGGWARIGPDLGGLTDQSVSPGACGLRELAKDWILGLPWCAEPPIAPEVRTLFSPLVHPVREEAGLSTQSGGWGLWPIVCPAGG